MENEGTSQSGPPPAQPLDSAKYRTSNTPVPLPNASTTQDGQRSRVLRSTKKEWGLLGQSGDLCLEDLQKQAKGVGLVYDERMLGHQSDWDSKHPENPARLTDCYTRCQHHGLVERCVPIKARSATEDEILSKHSRELLDMVKSTATMTQAESMKLSSQFDGVYFNNSTYEAAMLSAGSTIEAVDQVVRGKVRHSMALVRPPGHHAMKDEPCGYCIFNNVALAATHALDNLGLERILIVDWDVHHGQGIQYMFYDDPRVLYFSIHRYDWGKFWPNLRQSDYDFVGQNDGRGYNINMPINDTELTDGDYIAMLQQVLLPVAYEFNPQLVLIASGYDTAIGDPEGENLVTPVCFAHMTHMLKSLAGGKLSVILEGGYCPTSLAEGAALTLRELLDDPCPLLDPLPPPKPSTRELILQCIRVQGLYWHCFVYHEVSEVEEDLPMFFRDIQLPKQGIEFDTPETRPEKYELFLDYLLHSDEKVEKYKILITELIENKDLDKAPHRTCLVYDERMRKHKCSTNQSHPERPDRISRIYDKHKECGLLERCKRAEAREATPSELSLTHSTTYVERVQEFKSHDLETLQMLEGGFESVYLSPDVFECASLSAGCTLSVVDEVMSGQCQNGVCIVRPPGHHAEQKTAMGFCYFNNAAIAARYAQKKYKINRVLILDWDVHHGNGTQHIFADDPSVLYMSLHRHDKGWFFPSGPDGNYNQVGYGKGLGYNVNVSWLGGRHGDMEYITAFQQVIMPIAYEFGPELVLVSAGFDAARGDPLGGCQISPQGYAHMTHMLSGLAGGRVILVLEGGYNLYSISESMAACTSVLLGDLCPVVKLEPIIDRAVGTIQRVLDVQQKYWKSLRFRVFMPSREDTEAWLAKVQGSRTSKSKSDDNIDELTKQLQKSSVSDDESFSLKPEPASAAAEPRDVQADQPLLPSTGTHTDVSMATGPISMPTSPAPAAGAISMATVPESVNGVVAMATGKEPALPTVTMAGGDDPVGVTIATEPNVLEPLEGACGGSLKTELDHTVRQMFGDTLAEQEDLQMFAVFPLTWCPHLECVHPIPGGRLDTQAPCMKCDNPQENWICLTCYQVFCSRYINEHMVKHGLEWNHPLSLSYADLSVWCYACESYVHHEVLMPAKRAAHLDKFGEALPGV